VHKENRFFQDCHKTFTALSTGSHHNYTLPMPMTMAHSDE